MLLQVLTIQRHWQSELGPQRADKAVFMLQAMTTKTAQLPGDFINFCRSIVCNKIVNIYLIWPGQPGITLGFSLILSQQA